MKKWLWVKYFWIWSRLITPKLKIISKKDYLSRVCNDAESRAGNAGHRSPWRSRWTVPTPHSQTKLGKQLGKSALSLASPGIAGRLSMAAGPPVLAGDPPQGRQPFEPRKTAMCTLTCDPHANCPRKNTPAPFELASPKNKNHHQTLPSASHFHTARSKDFIDSTHT